MNPWDESCGNCGRRFEADEVKRRRRVPGLRGLKLVCGPCADVIDRQTELDVQTCVAPDDRAVERERRGMTPTVLQDTDALIRKAKEDVRQVKRWIDNDIAAGDDVIQVHADALERALANLGRALAALNVR